MKAENYQQAATQTGAMQTGSSHELHPSQDIVEYLREFARERPDVAAMWCFGIGFFLGWKLKPW